MQVTDRLGWGAEMFQNLFTPQLLNVRLRGGEVTLTESRCGS